jgi:hypothetical protein
MYCTNDVAIMGTLRLFRNCSVRAISSPFEFLASPGGPTLIFTEAVAGLVPLAAGLRGLGPLVALMAAEALTVEAWKIEMTMAETALAGKTMAVVRAGARSQRRVLETSRTPACSCFESCQHL